MLGLEFEAESEQLALAQFCVVKFGNSPERSQCFGCNNVSDVIKPTYDLGALARFCMVMFGNEATVQSDLLTFHSDRANRP